MLCLSCERNWKGLRRRAVDRVTVQALILYAAVVSFILLSVVVVGSQDGMPIWYERLTSLWNHSDSLVTPGTSHHSPASQVGQLFEKSVRGSQYRDQTTNKNDRTSTYHQGNHDRMVMIRSVVDGNRSKDQLLTNNTTEPEVDNPSFIAVGQNSQSHGFPTDASFEVMEGKDSYQDDTGIATTLEASSIVLDYSQPGELVPGGTRSNGTSNEDFFTTEEPSLQPVLVTGGDNSDNKSVRTIPGEDNCSNQTNTNNDRAADGDKKNQMQTKRPSSEGPILENRSETPKDESLIDHHPDATIVSSSVTHDNRLDKDRISTNSTIGTETSGNTDKTQTNFITHNSNGDYNESHTLDGKPNLEKNETELLLATGQTKYDTHENVSSESTIISTTTAPSLMTDVPTPGPSMLPPEAPMNRTPHSTLLTTISPTAVVRISSPLSQPPTALPTTTAITSEPTSVQETIAPAETQNIKQRKKESLGQEAEDIIEDPNVRIASAILILISIFLLICVAQQLVENPDGVCSRLCRFTVALVRILCLPLNRLTWMLLDSRQKARRTHELVATHGYDDYDHDLVLS